MRLLSAVFIASSLAIASFAQAATYTDLAKSVSYEITRMSTNNYNGVVIEYKSGNSSGGEAKKKIIVSERALDKLRLPQLEFMEYVREHIEIDISCNDLYDSGICDSIILTQKF